jgi:hypothetical protein
MLDYDQIVETAEALVDGDEKAGRALFHAGAPRPRGHKLRDRALQRGWDNARADAKKQSEDELPMP